MAKPLICAHAGCEGKPLDGLEAIEAGIAAGADFVELDLRFTADGTPVLSHDAFDGRSRRNLHTLDEALAVLAGAPAVGVNVDVKDLAGLIRHPTPLTAGTLPNPVYFTGLKAHQVGSFRRTFPGLAYTVNDLPWWFGWASAHTRVEALRQCRENGVLALNLSFRLVDDALMEAARQAGLPVRVWTVDDGASMIEMARLGVEVITTNRVSELRGLVGDPERLLVFTNPV